MKTMRESTMGRATLRLVQTAEGYAGIVIANGAATPPIRGDDADDVWRQLCDEAAKSDPSFFGYDGARKRFLRIFHEGFAAPAYDRQERGYKIAAKEKLDTVAPLAQALSGSGLGEAVLGIFRATNLLSPFEKVRLQEALRSQSADAFIQGAARFAQGEKKRGLVEMAQALKPHGVAKWTAVTYLPFLWSPDTQMFLKPAVTNNFASRVGHRFAHDYTPELQIGVYESLLDLTAETEREISELAPRDRIDVQSFIWVVGEYAVENEKGVE
jgi:hypothetical protein